MSEPTPLLAPTKSQIASPRLWVGDRFVVNNWLNVSDDDALPNAGSSIISLSRWRSNCAGLKAEEQSFGIRVLPTETLEIVSDHIHQSQLLALVFPKFTDGRAYSIARSVRDAGFSGEIRATGDVLLDQLPLMLRAGFTSFEITNHATIEFLETRHVPAIFRVYQIGSEATTHVWKLRRIERPNTSVATSEKRAS